MALDTGDDGAEFGLEGPDRLVELGIVHEAGGAAETLYAFAKLSEH